MFSFFRRKQNPENLIENLKALWKVPEKNWYEGRRTPVIKVFQTLSNKENSKYLSFPNSGTQNVISAWQLSVYNETYILFEEVDPNAKVSHWFQLEKRINKENPNIYRTELILSSDNNAKTQGAFLLKMIEDKV